jgi:hypothetical protein
VNEREIVLRNDLPANAEGAEVVVPAIGAFDDPATGPTFLAASLFLTAATKMEPNTAASDGACGVVVVVAFVEAKIARPTRTPRRPERNGVERFAGEPLVVDVRAGQRDCDRDAPAVGEDVAFRAKLSTICRIGTGKAPPFGAFTEALSREHQFQSIPRFSS